MTPDQIRALKPGPELDRAVCEIIMEVKNPARPPAYSTTWAGLGLVVEEMERRGYDHMTEYCRLAPEPHGTGFHFGAEADIFGRFDGPDRFENTAKAALLALAAERAGRGEG